MIGGKKLIPGTGFIPEWPGEKDIISAVPNSAYAHIKPFKAVCVFLHVISALPEECVKPHFLKSFRRCTLQDYLQLRFGSTLCAVFWRYDMSASDTPRTADSGVSPMAVICDGINFDYSIELWRSKVPLSSLSKRRLKARFDISSCMLVAGGTVLAQGHIKEGKFIIDQLFEEPTASSSRTQEEPA